MADKPVRTDKATAVAELTEHFRSSRHRAHRVPRPDGRAAQDPAPALGPQATYAVAKNTLAKRAAAEAGITGLDDLFSGPTALAFVSGDVVEAAKGLREFAKANPLLVIKGGVFEGKPLSAAEVSKLADLESREVLLAKLAGALKANLSKAAATFQAPLTRPHGGGRAGRPSAKSRARSSAAQRPGDAPPGRAEPADLYGPSIRIRKGKPPWRSSAPRAPRRVQGDDADRALGVREAVRGDLRRQGRRPGRSPAVRPAPAAAAEEAAAEQDEFDVILENDGGKKIQVIKVVRELTGLGLKEAKDLVEAAPKAVVEKANKENAEKAKAKLEAEGAKVTLK